MSGQEGEMDDLNPDAPFTRIESNAINLIR